MAETQWQKPNRELPAASVSYEGPNDAKKIDLTGLGEDENLYI